MSELTAEYNKINQLIQENKQLNSELERTTTLLKLQVSKRDAKIQYLEKRLSFYKNKLITISRRN